MKKFLTIGLVLFLITGCFGEDEKIEVEVNDEPEEVEERAGETLNVPGDYETISLAIENADNGDTIVVEVGRYEEDLNFDGKNIKLTSSDPNNEEIVAETIIQGSGNGPVIRIDSGESSETVVTGFTITGGKYDYGAAINVGPLLSRTSPTISNNIFTENTAMYGGAIYLHESNAIIKNNQFIENIATMSGGAIYASSNASITIENNIFRNNHADLYGGAIFVTMSSPVISGNQFIENIAEVSDGAISVVGDEANPKIDDNEFTDNEPNDMSD